MRVTREEIRAGTVKQRVKCVVSGATGTGKTYFALTFPKYAWVGTEPGGFDTARSNPHLLENMAWMDEFVPSPTEDIKLTFERL